MNVYIPLLLISLGTIVATKVIAGLIIAQTSGQGLVFIWLVFKTWKRLLVSLAAALILTGLGTFAGFPVIAVIGGSIVCGLVGTVFAFLKPI